MFFDGTDASNIAVDSNLTWPNGTTHLAAARMYTDPTSASGYNFGTGDNSNALAQAGARAMQQTLLDYLK